VTLLSEHVRQHGTLGSEQWLFSAAGHLWNRNSAGNQWRRAREASGLADFTLHDCRDFFASGLIASGCDVVTVQRALGHSSPTITLSVYAHLWPNAEDRTRVAAAGLMESMLGRPADSLQTETVGYLTCENASVQR
jgi:integrase